MLIALSLTAILLTFLFSSLVQNTRAEKKLETARTEITQRALLQTLIGDIFCSPIASFNTENQDLKLIFDHGIDPDPQFSGDISARIFLDKNKNLSLQLTPLGRTEPTRSEILLANVDAFSFQFLDTKLPCSWKGEWHDAKLLPSLIRLQVNQGKERIQFAFILPSRDPVISYRQEK